MKTVSRDELDSMIDHMDDAISEGNIPAVRSWKADIDAAIAAAHDEALAINSAKDRNAKARARINAAAMTADDLIATVANGDEDEISRLACSAELAHRCGPVTNVAACAF
ncbi:hypothetical protein DVA43_02450 [Leclercia sp. W6]|uniref:hypothetical protein n=1 Tax=Leclercia sp. W6 TaxID=2282310 RepID=UPI000DF16584|nr:hypothetical protein [Leclercia sp. W6]AXF58495.1 hypothetical protein DVA43_02450 [Leclercia sp. W6]